MPPPHPETDLDDVVARFRPIVGFKIRRALGAHNPDWEDLTNEVLAQTIEKVKAGIEKVKEALKGNDNEAIKKATEELQKPLYEMSAAAYQSAQQAAGAQGAPGAGPQPGAQQSEAKKDDDNIVDAEYTEVKDDKK